MDLSLDDIIKMKKQPGNNKKPGSNNRPGNSTNKPRLQRLRNLGARSNITRKPAQIQQSPVKEVTMLHVSNLDFNVTTEDVRELFSEIGPIKKAEVHYDKSGRSLGTAEISFRTRDAAIKAIKKYNNLPLDGRPMSITLVPSKTNLRLPTNNHSNNNINKPKGGIQKRTPNKGNLKNNRTQGTKGGKKFTKQPRKEVTAEELDADLDQYKSRTKTTAMQH